MNSKAKLFTFISRSAPYGCNRPQLCLDAALATAVFEQEVQYLLMDDGVFQLLNDQQGDAIGSKTLGNAMETLELYGIEKVLVDSNSMDERGLEDRDLLMPVERVSDEDIRSLVAKSDYVINL